jgi:hypothetical protein
MGQYSAVQSGVLLKFFQPKLAQSPTQKADTPG